MISIIVATDQNGLIGDGNRLPWHLPADLQFFKKNTLNKPIIMGRKTWDSLPGLLPDRRHIVISRNHDKNKQQGFDAASSLLDAIEMAKDSEEIMIIGGASIIEQALPLADKIYMTRIHHAFKGDCYLPELDWEQWQETSRESHQADEKNHYDYDFIIYKKKPGRAPGKNNTKGDNKKLS